MVGGDRSGGSSGLTLIEVLIALAIGGLVLTAGYGTYRQQLRSYSVTEDVAAMQQNLRAAMYFLERDIRMAAADPSGRAGARFMTATRDEIQFTMDFTGGQGDGLDNNGNRQIDEVGEWFDGDTGDANERVRYALRDDDILGKESAGAGGLQQVAENIDAIDFVYFDENGNRIDEDGNGSVLTRLDDIRVVEVTLVARTMNPDADYSDPGVYLNSQDFEFFDPSGSGLHFRRRVLFSRIVCRNMGAGS